MISSFVLNMSFWHLTYIRSNVYIIVFDFRKKCWWRWLRRLAQWLFVVNIWRHLPTLETGPHQHPTVFVLTKTRPSEFFLFIYKITSALENKMLSNLLLLALFWRKIVHLSFLLNFDKIVLLWKQINRVGKFAFFRMMQNLAFLGLKFR